MFDWYTSRIHGPTSLESIRFQLKIQILTNQLGAGDPLPSVRDLIEATKQEPHVVLEALNGLVEEGVLSWNGEQHIVAQGPGEIIESDESLNAQFVLFNQIRLHIVPGDKTNDTTKEFVTFLRSLLSPMELGDAPVSPPRYIRNRVIARGGMGEIIEAYDSRLHRTIALKMLAMEAGDLDGSTETFTDSVRNNTIRRLRFWREMIVTARLEHPSIIPVYDLPEDSFGLAYAMKRVAGRTLGDEIRDRTSPGERMELLEHYTNVLNAVAYAHSQGVLHRDLKPSNIMIGEFGETYVIDWGLASRIGANEPAGTGENRVDWDSELTKTGATLGTPGYAAPEQFGHSDIQVGETADVFALGMVLVSMLSGQRIEKPALLYADSSEREEYLRDLLESAPSELGAICLKAVQFEPGNRYASVMELKRDIDAYRQGRFVGAHEYTIADRVANQYRRHRVLANAALIAVVLVVSVSLVSAWRLSNVNTQLTESNTQLQRESVTSNLRLANQYLEQGNWYEARSLLASMPAAAKERWSWRLMNTLAHPYERMIHAVDSPIYAIVDTPDPDVFVLLSRSGVFQWRDRSTMELLGELRNDQPMLSFSHTQDGSALLYTGIDGVTHIVDAQSMMIEHSLTVSDMSRTYIQSASIVTNGQAILGVLRDGNVATWESADDQTPEIHEVNDSFNSVSASPDGKRFALLRSPAEVCVYSSLDLETPEFVVPGHGLRWSRDGATLMTWDGESIRIVDDFASDDRGFLSRRIDGTRIMDASVDSGTGLAVFIGFDGNVFRADIGEQRWLEPLRSESNLSTILSFEDGVADISNTGGEVERWDMASGSRQWIRRGHMSQPYASTLGHTSRFTIYGDGQGDLIEWNVARSGLVQIKQIHDDAILSVALSSDGRQFATQSLDGSVKLFDKATFTELWSSSFPNYDGRYTAGLKFVNDDQHLVASYGGRNPAILTAATGEVVDTLVGHKDDVAYMYLDETNQRLYTSTGSEIATWDLRDYSLIAIRENDENVHMTAASVDAERITITVGTKNGRILLLNGVSLATRASFQSHDSRVVGVVSRIGENGDLVAVGLDGTVKVWSLGDHTQPVATFKVRSMPQSIQRIENGGYVIFDTSYHATVFNARQLEAAVVLPTQTVGLQKMILSNENELLWTDNRGNLSILKIR